MVREKQLRLVYSLLKPALRMAARFGVPIRSLTELVRLAYFEVLTREGLPQAEIAERFGQSTRHLRSLAKRFESDFFAAEQEVGLLREIEDYVAVHRPTEPELLQAFSGLGETAVRAAMAALLREERLERVEDSRLQIGRRYVVLASDQFHHRIDALNHHLDGIYRAVVQRMLRDERETAMIKTINFSADPSELHAYLQRLEGELRRELAALDESAAFHGHGESRFVLGLTMAGNEPPLDASHRK